MPSRKSESSETSHRSSLRRLSSLASLHALNPFARRRSTNNVNGTPSTTSLASLSSSLALDSSPDSAPPPGLPQMTMQSPQMPSSMIPPRKSSYVCLPDDPIGGMPRSRTYSNLPIPTSRTKKPSLNMSKAKLSRSDTEPLLQVGASYGDSAAVVGRSTAFKENISLSPIGDPSIDLTDHKAFYGSALPSRAHACRHGRGIPLTNSSPAHTHSSSTASLAQYGNAPRQSGCSPTQRIVRDATKRASIHGDIKQNRLLSAIQAQSPVPAQLASSPLERSMPERTRTTTEMSTPVARPRASSKTGITRAEPPGYWTGRFSSLNDRFRNEELLASQPGTDRPTQSETNHARMRRAMEHLWYQCITDEAKQSFVRWQKQLAGAMGNPELGKPIGDSAKVKSCALEMSLRVEEEEGPPSSGSGKVRFMNKIFGKKGKIVAA